VEKCKICGEWVDWDNPNIHYGGHVCKITTGKETPWNKEETKIKINIKMQLKQLKAIIHQKIIQN